MDLEESPISEQETEPTPGHPIATLFFLLFKTLALAIYLFSSFLFSETTFVIPFILCVLFLAFDLWTTKNVAGRLMVGLRWWNEGMYGFYVVW